MSNFATVSICKQAFLTIMGNNQLSLFNDFIKAYETEKKEAQKTKKETAEGDFKFTFLVNSSHIQVWRDCDIKTAQRRLRRIKKSLGIAGGSWLTFEQVAKYEGWNSQILLDEMVTRRLRLKERHKDRD
ncbi:MAG: hypothetical protein H7339_18900 [Arcicella sp.]|nr:hypothetical protein [Arcicella sp.]